MTGLTDVQKSGLLFVFACIPTRLALVYLAYNKTFKYLPYITMLMGLGFLYIYFTGDRKTGSETFGRPIWWNDMRLFHGLMYVGFSILALLDCKGAWMLLGADVAAGIGAFIQHGP